MDAALVGFCQKSETWCANPSSNKETNANMEGWSFDEFWTLNQDKVLRYFRFAWRRSATEHLQPMLQAENMTFGNTLKIAQPQL